MIMADKQIRVGLLSTIDAPLLGYQLRDLLDLGCCIDALLFDSKLMSAKDHEIHHERTTGRMPPIPLGTFEKAEIPAYFVNNHNSSITADLVRRLDLDLLVNAGTPRILSSDALTTPRIGVLNCHPGLLPDFRGCTCVEWAIYLDKQVGNTVHLMSEGIDEGPIVMKEGLTFSATDTYQDVRVKVFSAGSRLMAQAVHGIQTRKIDQGLFIPQGNGEYHSVIDAEKMAQVHRKLEAGEYAFQEQAQ